MRKTRWAIWLGLGVSLAVAFLVAAYPMQVIQPFRAQGADELAWALAVKRWGWVAAAAAVVIGGYCTVRIWRGSGRFVPRALATIGLLLTCVFAAVTRVNVFEIMFHRVDNVETVGASEAALDGDDMVMAVKEGGEARGYPIRMMAYHHIANDWVGGTPIAATY